LPSDDVLDTQQICGSYDFGVPDEVVPVYPKVGKVVRRQLWKEASSLCKSSVNRVHDSEPYSKKKEQNADLVET